MPWCYVNPFEQAPLRLVPPGQCPTQAQGPACIDGALLFAVPGARYLIPAAWRDRCPQKLKPPCEMDQMTAPALKTRPTMEMGIARFGSTTSHSRLSSAMR